MQNDKTIFYALVQWLIILFCDIFQIFFGENRMHSVINEDKPLPSIFSRREAVFFLLEPMVKFLRNGRNGKVFSPRPIVNLFNLFLKKIVEDIFLYCPLGTKQRGDSTRHRGQITNELNETSEK